ncbi:hypothetical protein J2X15_004178 [Rhodoferax saidenbachensis]|uniref:Uncharacterized protein n=1 Tax=Rhodoferax saidenbachensis TaxID=1484693 RepID=A0ABU1ZTG7_9BURK|nr:hypothetical protein [Rhodoferax saidenbachensis]
MAKALVSLYVIAVLGLLATAVATWRLQCESFGCMGVGVAWFAWVIAFCVVVGQILTLTNDRYGQPLLSASCQSTGISRGAAFRRNLAITLCRANATHYQ